MFAIITWWFVDAHKWFKGPKVNVEHRMLDRDEDLIDGLVVNNDNRSSSGTPSLTKSQEAKM